MSFISQKSSDAPEFIARVEAVISQAILVKPDRLILMRVDNWFGERWIECAAPVHVKQPSVVNFRNFVAAKFPTTVLIWFSDKSVQNGRGSVMAYVPAEAGHEPWYAEFSERRGWGSTRLIGLTRSELAIGSEPQTA